MMMTLNVAYLQDIPSGLNKIAEATPYSIAVYGVLVFVLAIIAYLQFKERKETTEKFIDHVKESNTLMENVERRMDGLSRVEALLNKIETILLIKGDSQ